MANSDRGVRGESFIGIEVCLVVTGFACVRFGFSEFDTSLRGQIATVIQ